MKMETIAAQNGTKDKQGKQSAIKHGHKFKLYLGYYRHAQYIY